MEIVRQSLLFLHFVGLAVLLGGFFVQWRARSTQVTMVMVVGAGAQILTGLLLVGARALQDRPIDGAQTAAKLIVGLLVVILAQLGRRRSEVTGLFYAVGLLTLVDVGIAVFWD
jgi:hypothetical protein